MKDLLKDSIRKYLRNMKAKALFIRFLMVFVVALAANVLVSIIWSYFIKKTGLVVDWEATVRISLLLAIVIPLIQRKK